MVTLTEEQIKLVKATAPVFQQQGKVITSHFYKRMLGNHPELNNIFNSAHQQTGAQPAALAHAVFAYAANIDNLGVLGKAVSLIAHKHCTLNITPDQYSIVGENLLATIKELLGDAVSDETMAAWKVAYQMLADILIGVEKNLYDSAAAMEGGWRGWRKFTIAKKEKESNHITSFYLEPVDGKCISSYKPGQFISVKQYVPELGYEQPRQYTISTAPNNKYLRISVKHEMEHDNSPHGKVSSLLHENIKEGSQIDVSPPFGDFFLNEEEDKPVVLISAGVGLTPMIAMLETLTKPKEEGADKMEPRKVVFVHGAHTKGDHAMREYTQKIISDNKNITRSVWYSDVSGATEGVEYDHAGRIDLAKIQKEIMLEGADYYICGPKSFMTDMENQLIHFGIKNDRIHNEFFGNGL